MRAYAYVVGPQDQHWMDLFDLVASLDFVGFSSFRGLAQVEQQLAETPICYFLFSSVADLAPLRPVAKQIRHSSFRHLRFLPLIYIARDVSAETIMECVNMGFDDVVALPQSAQSLLLRLDRQIRVPQVYYEAGGYFGPDRRNRVAGFEQRPMRKRVGGAFRRIHIIRDLDHGIAIQRDQIVDAGSVAAMQTLQ